MEKKKKYISKEEAIKKLEHYCAYQDRCHKEVRQKLYDLGAYGDDLENVIVHLIAENFLNEERFAKSYARGRFRMKDWGRYRIVRELKFRNVSEYCIKKALAELEEEDYEGSLRAFLLRKIEYTRAKDKYDLKNKIAKMALRRGFESPLVWQTLRELDNEGKLWTK